MTNDILTQNELKSILHYNPETGLFTWLISNSKRVKVGDVAGSLSNGYVLICFNKKNYLGHRLAWLYMMGAWPKDQIDHVNGIKNDNHWCNVREATVEENQQNRKNAKKNSASSLLGVSWHKKANKWQVYISANKKSKYLGLFENKQEAYEAYLDKKREIHEFCTI